MYALLISGIMSMAQGGNKGEFKSTYNNTQLQGIEDIWKQIQSMKGGSSDITQNQNYQNGSNWLNSLYNDPEFFKSFEAPLQRQFEEQTVPGLANRFAGMGSGGSLGSTAFRNQLGREGSNLSTNIAALRGGMQQQGVNQSLQYAQQPFQNLMQLYQQAMNPTQNVYQPPSSGGWGDIFSSLAGNPNTYGYGNPSQGGGISGGSGRQASGGYGY